MSVDKVRQWIHIFAEALDYYRIAPRFIVFMYGTMMWRMMEWIMTVPEPTTQQVSLVGTVFGAAAGIFAFYVNSGHSWEVPFVFWEKANNLKDDTKSEEK